MSKCFMYKEVQNLRELYIEEKDLFPEDNTKKYVINFHTGDIEGFNLFNDRYRMVCKYLNLLDKDKKPDPIVEGYLDYYGYVDDTINEIKTRTGVEGLFKYILDENNEPLIYHLSKDHKIYFTRSDYETYFPINEDLTFTNINNIKYLVKGDTPIKYCTDSNYELFKYSNIPNNSIEQKGGTYLSTVGIWNENESTRYKYNEFIKSKIELKYKNDEITETFPIEFWEFTRAYIYSGYQARQYQILTQKEFDNRSKNQFYCGLYNTVDVLGKVFEIVYDNTKFFFCTCIPKDLEEQKNFNNKLLADIVKMIKKNRTHYKKGKNDPLCQKIFAKWKSDPNKSDFFDFQRNMISKIQNQYKDWLNEQTDKACNLETYNTFKQQLAQDNLFKDIPFPFSLYDFMDYTYFTEYVYGEIDVKDKILLGLADSTSVAYGGDGEYDKENYVSDREDIDGKNDENNAIIHQILINYKSKNGSDKWKCEFQSKVKLLRKLFNDNINIKDQNIDQMYALINAKPNEFITRSDFMDLLTLLQLEEQAAEQRRQDEEKQRLKEKEKQEERQRHGLILKNAYRIWRINFGKEDTQINYTQFLKYTNSLRFDIGKAESFFKGLCGKEKGVPLGIIDALFRNGSDCDLIDFYPFEDNISGVGGANEAAFHAKMQDFFISKSGKNVADLVESIMQNLRIIAKIR